MYDKDDLKMFLLCILFIISNVIGLIIAHRVDLTINMNLFRLIFASNIALFVAMIIAGYQSGSRK